jgi:hypothetical protein
VWKNGDFEVISSDNVRFRIDSFYLFAHRWVSAPPALTPARSFGRCTASTAGRSAMSP